VKFLRRLLIFLAVALALVALLFAIALLPPVQTAIAQSYLDRQEGLKTSLGAVSAGFGKVEVNDLRLTADGVVLQLPSVQAGLSVTAAILEGKGRIRSLVARGWTLDLSRNRALEDLHAQFFPAPAPAGGAEPSTTPNTIPPQTAADLVRAALASGRLPYDVSVDEFELEDRKSVV
jgi:hypothetical protein